MGWGIVKAEIIVCKMANEHSAANTARFTELCSNKTGTFPKKSNFNDIRLVQNLSYLLS
jgi:hypothetical protein